MRLSRSAAFRTTQLLARLPNAVLSDHRAEIATAGFFEGPQGRERAHIVHGADQRSFHRRAAQKPSDHIENLIEITLSIQVNYRRLRNGRQFLAQPSSTPVMRSLGSEPAMGSSSSRT